MEVTLYHSKPVVTTEGREKHRVQLLTRRQRTKGGGTGRSRPDPVTEEEATLPDHGTVS